jgi:hypothetical protein
VNTVMKLRIPKGGEFLDQRGDYQLLKNDSVPWSLLVDSSLSWIKHALKMTTFWDVAPCSLVEVHRRFRDACCVVHHHENRR